MNKFVITLLSILMISCTSSNESQSDIFSKNYDQKQNRHPASIKKVEKDLTDLPDSFDQLAKSLGEPAVDKKKKDQGMVEDMSEKLTKDTEVWQ